VTGENAEESKLDMEAEDDGLPEGPPPPLEMLSRLDVEAILNIAK
jgi:hypothetical protein